MTQDFFWQAFQAVVFGNAATISIIYGFWYSDKHEKAGRSRYAMPPRVYFAVIVPLCILLYSVWRVG
jgi:hypothetical protein